MSNRKERLFAKVTFPDGKLLKIYRVISAEEFKMLIKLVNQGDLSFSNTAQAISAN